MRTEAQALTAVAYLVASPILEVGRLSRPRKVSLRVVCRCDKRTSCSSKQPVVFEGSEVGDHGLSQEIVKVLYVSKHE